MHFVTFLIALHDRTVRFQETQCHLKLFSDLMENVLEMPNLEDCSIGLLVTNLSLTV